MELAEELKQKGNTFFINGDINEAVQTYQKAIDVLIHENTKKYDEEIEKDNSTEKKLLAVLYSNLSNVYQIQKRYNYSWEAAQQATLFDPTFLKAWFRYINTRRLDGYPFEAFVTLLKNLRPLLRNHTSFSESGIKLINIVEEIERPLYEDLGLSNVLPHIELQDYEGGVGIVARNAIKPNEVILIEKKFETSFAEMDLGVQNDLTTVKIVIYFAKKIFPHLITHSERWEHFNKQFKGCWPRRSEDISVETRSEIANALRSQLPEMSDGDFEDLFSFSVMCRYNCFHSGFFRACALANHSCHANAAMKYNPKDETVTLIAVRPIEAGEFVNVKYLSDAQFLMGVGKRREYLRSWLFWCGCDRCNLDNNNISTQEQVKCRNCNQYTHLPLSGDISGTNIMNNNNNNNNNIDPMIPKEKLCNYCGEIVTWTQESRDIVARLMYSFNEVTTYTSHKNLIEWLLHNLQQVSELQVHPNHWLYRVLLYFFCVPMTSIVNENFGLFAKLGWQNSRVEVLLKDYGVRNLYTGIITKSSKTNKNNIHDNKDDEVNSNNNNNNNTDITELKEVNGGGDVLYALCILWRLISPFYPEYEGWALHRAICQLSLFSHTHPNESLALSAVNTLILLQRHGKYIGSKDAALWLQVYNQHKSTDQRKGLLTVKQIKNVLKS